MDDKINHTPSPSTGLAEKYSLIPKPTYHFIRKYSLPTSGNKNRDHYQLEDGCHPMGNIK